MIDKFKGRSLVFWVKVLVPVFLIAVCLFASRYYIKDKSEGEGIVASSETLSITNTKRIVATFSPLKSQLDSINFRVIPREVKPEGNLFSAIVDGDGKEVRSYQLSEDEAAGVGWVSLIFTPGTLKPSKKYTFTLHSDSEAAGFSMLAGEPAAKEFSGWSYNDIPETGGIEMFFHYAPTLQWGDYLKFCLLCFAITAFLFGPVYFEKEPVKSQNAPVKETPVDSTDKIDNGDKTDE